MDIFGQFFQWVRGPTGSVIQGCHKKHTLDIQSVKNREKGMNDILELFTIHHFLSFYFRFVMNIESIMLMCYYHIVQVILLKSYSSTSRSYHSVIKSLTKIVQLFKIACRIIEWNVLQRIATPFNAHYHYHIRESSSLELDHCGKDLKQ